MTKSYFLKLHNYHFQCASSGLVKLWVPEPSVWVERMPFAKLQNYSHGQC